LRCGRTAWPALPAKGGGFVKKESDVFKRYAPLEDVAALFFDADGDKDLDLFIGTGGNNTAFQYELQNRLYLNDGRGAFALSPHALPASGVNVRYWQRTILTKTVIRTCL
jgi:hypothetical protein